jgi:PmbA protein
LQRDFAYSTARCAEDIDAVASVGRLAAERSVKRLNPQKISTRNAPVLMTPDMARSFIGHFVGAVRGGALYRRASFLEGQLGESIFPSFVQLGERPHLPRAMGSAAYDAEGVATAERDLVADGVLQGYLLDSYSARKLGMQTTANAGAIHNLELAPGDDDFEAMLKRMDTGFLVTEMMGSGVNGVTGDYSRGASGFWVEGGVIQYPVAEVTVAGQLRDMFGRIVAVGSDLDTRSSLRTPSILLESAAIAGS